MSLIFYSSPLPHGKAFKFFVLLKQIKNWLCCLRAFQESTGTDCESQCRQYIFQMLYAVYMCKLITSRKF